MNNALLSLVSVLALTPLVTQAVRGAESGSRDPQVDTVLTRYIEATGGRAAIEKVSSRILKATFEGLGLPAGLDWTLYAKAPNKQVSEMEVAGMGRVAEGFDGQVGWSLSPFAGLRVKEGQELAKLKRDADLHRDLHMQTTYPDLAAKGSAQVNGADAVMLEAKPAADSIERFYFEAKTGLLVRQDSEFPTPDGRMKVQMVLSDFRAVDGVKYPHVMRFGVAMPDQQAIEFTIKVTQVRHNVPIDDAKFVKPGA